MECYFAPMEGITGYIYRNAHDRVFGGVDKYFTPFLSPNQNRSFTSRELNDILPQHNQGVKVVPQLLTCNAQDFIWAAKELQAFGYGEINLNLGCPSGTVVAKKKGAGFLTQPDELDRFLDTVFSELNMKISIKTRLGKSSPEEFGLLMQIYNRYPLEELIIHPRVQKDFYKNHPNLEAFGEALAVSSNPVCYNGDIFSREDYEKFHAAFPEVTRIMCGRGMVANPALASQLKGDAVLEKQRLKEFHDVICQEYQKIMSGDRNVLFRMKELWNYMSSLFPDMDKNKKKIRKTQHMDEYQKVISGIFEGEEQILSIINRNFVL